MKEFLILAGTTLYMGVLNLRAGVITLNCPQGWSGPFTVVSNIVGGNSLTNLFRGKMSSTQVLIWDAILGDYILFLPADFGPPGWSPFNAVLPVQSALFVGSPGNQTFTWTTLDATVVPQPLTLQSNVYYLRGPATNGISRFEDIVGAPPNNETSLFRYVGGPNGYVYPPKPPSWKAYHFVGGAWTPEEPMFNALEAAFIVYPTLRITATVTGAPPSLVLTWPRGTLESTEQSSGPWQAVSGAQSHYVVDPAGTNLSRFYRVREWP